jgi:hypothetical protein
VNINPAISRAAGRAALVISKNSPQLLFGGGMAGFAGTVFLACRATSKIGPVLDDFEKEKARVESEVDEKHQQRELTLVYGNTIIKIAKLYAPAAGLGILTVAMLTGSHHILSRRNLAMMAAYKALDEGFRQYRQRVAEEVGEERETELRHDLRREVEVAKKDGEVALTGKVRNPEAVSIHARFFDELSVNWNPNPEFNLIYLTGIQDQANYKLKSRGHLFLNEVYDMLGIPRSQAGQVVGWILGPGNHNHIDFGVYRGHERGRRFVNGDEPAILLDFNVDEGIIWDQDIYKRVKQL